MARVLRPGGVLIFTLGRRRPAYDLWRRFVYYPLVDLARPLYIRLTGRPRPVVYHVQKVYADSWVAAHLPADLAVERIVHSNLRPLPMPLDRLLPGLDAALLRRLEGAGQGWLRPLAAALIVKARKR
jgi:hypothetical protein